jgi:hypothetical protein
MGSITVKKEKHDLAGSSKKINFGMLRLLETLTLVSTNQLRQINAGKKTKKVLLQLFVTMMSLT